MKGNKKKTKNKIWTHDSKSNKFFLPSFLWSFAVATCSRKVISASSSTYCSYSWSAVSAQVCHRLSTKKNQKSIAAARTSFVVVVFTPFLFVVFSTASAVVKRGSKAHPLPATIVYNNNKHSQRYMQKTTKMGKIRQLLYYCLVDFAFFPI